MFEVGIFRFVMMFSIWFGLCGCFWFVFGEGILFVLCEELFLILVVGICEVRLVVIKFFVV